MFPRAAKFCRICPLMPIVGAPSIEDMMASVRSTGGGFGIVAVCVAIFVAKFISGQQLVRMD